MWILAFSLFFTRIFGLARISALLRVLAKSKTADGRV